MQDLSWVITLPPPPAPIVIAPAPPTGASTPASPPPPTTRRSRLGSQKALWLIGIGLLANAGVMLYSHGAGASILPDLVLDRAALAQAAPEGQPLGARGIYMMPAQLGPNDFGLYLMDVDSSTICVYQAIPQSSRFRLMAARSFKYDRFLEDQNNDKPTPKQVQQLVENERQREALHAKDEAPTVPQTAKPDENLPDPAPGAMK